MGHRAHYILKDQGTWRLFYSHWGSNTIEHHFFWGPANALDFILDQRELGQQEWMNEIWCEGGAVLDLDEESLIFFGGEDLRYDPFLKEHCLALMRIVWEGWSIEWASQGVVDLAGAVDVPAHEVLSTMELETSTKPPDFLQLEHSRTLLSVRFEEGQCACRPVPNRLEELICLPQTVWQDALERMPRNVPVDLQKLADTGFDFPSEGLHVDLETKTLSYWFTGYQEHEFLWPATWSSWTLDPLGESGHHQQLKLCGLPPLEMSKKANESIKELSTILLGRQSGINPQELLNPLLKSREPGEVQVNPMFFAHKEPELSDEWKRATFTQALNLYWSRSTVAKPVDRP